MQIRSLDQEDPLEEGMATHSSILAWRILMDKGAWWATVHGLMKSCPKHLRLFKIIVIIFKNSLTFLTTRARAFEEKEKCLYPHPFDLIVTAKSKSKLIKILVDLRIKSKKAFTC